jgi:hypothetical protein
MKKVMAAAFALSALFAASGNPSQAASVAHQSAATCTGLKLACLSGTRNRCLYLGGARLAKPVPYHAGRSARTNATLYGNNA